MNATDEAKKVRRLPNLAEQSLGEDRVFEIKDHPVNQEDAWNSYLAEIRPLQDEIHKLVQEGWDVLEFPETRTDGESWSFRAVLTREPV